MRLVCPKCSSQYEVDISLFPDEGREVQCSNCEEIWFQHPVEDEMPLRLDGISVDEPDEDDEPRPTRPSQRLKDDEQRDLAAAVQAEIAARDERPDSPAEDRPRSRRKIERSSDPVAEDEILSQLREQIEKEGGDFESGGPTKSAKRNLAKAAEHAGIAVGDEQSERGGGRNVSTGDRDTDDTSPKGRKAQRGGTKSKRAKRVRDGKLADALRDIETTRQRPSMGFRHGFLTAVIIAMIGSGVYMFQDDIARSYPEAAPWLDRYDQLVVRGRVQAQTLYVEFRPVVQDLIDQASAKVSELTSGDAGAGE